MEVLKIDILELSPKAITALYNAVDCDTQLEIIRILKTDPDNWFKNLIEELEK
jgi:hypothetical protein